MSEENLEIVRRIYCRTLSLDPELLVGLAKLATPDTVFDFKVYSDREGALEAAGLSA